MPPNGITEAEWQKHIDEDKRQTQQIDKLYMLILGDDSKPETVRESLKYTMIRINAFIDVWKWIGGIFIAAAITMPFWLPLMKEAAHALAK